ncbi:rhodanese-like domain-containing protein [Bacteroidia bacterium]|jgi:rhodanese-related sulfurtransferase|nr:rhodanese-like domain-containing protein [Bacteroidia bacterium]|tara:strand:- start:342 stop:719 length:378 start_codon:yes stop_codon:yes gene_type:complete
MKQLFILFVTITAFAACNAQSDEVRNLSQQDLTAKLQEKNTVLIDVRTSIEVAGGYIPEAEYFIDINGANFEQKIAELDTTKTYIMYCRSGGRSGKAYSYMVKNGFSKVYNLEGGILDYTGKLKQ